MMNRRQFVHLVLGTVAATLASKRCRTCGTPTDVHLIDCSRPLGSRERARTVCFTCTPEARVIDKYFTGFATAMHYHKHKTKCSQCGVGPGFYHVADREFEYRLCSKCAPDAVNCRRWVRDLRG